MDHDYKSKNSLSVIVLVLCLLVCGGGGCGVAVESILLKVKSPVPGRKASLQASCCPMRRQQHVSLSNFKRTDSFSFRPLKEISSR